MTAMEASYGRWAAERLALVEGRELHPDVARAHYLAWHVDRGLTRRATRGKQRAAIKAVGGRCEGTGSELRYLDVALAGPLLDSGDPGPGSAGQAIEAGRGC